MYSWVKLSHLVQWSGGTLIHPPSTDLSVLAISSDSRALKKGDVFLALRGENFDGHRFLEEAVQLGALALISQQKVPTTVPLILVSDTLQAFIKIAEKLREYFRGPVVAVTGSAGKSSTRDMIAVLLGPDTLSAPASFNNLLGVSKTLCLLEDSTKNLVLELGMNASLEIKEMCERFQPLAGLITNIGDAHIGKLGSEEGIFRAKKELFDFITTYSNALGIALNLDDPFVVRAYQESAGSKLKTVTYSLKDPKAHVYVSDYSLHPERCCLKLTIKMNQESFSTELGIFGLHNAQNIAAAIACASLLGVSMPEIKLRLSELKPPAHRGVIIQIGKNVTLVDESYNSNPSALKSSLQSVWELNPKRRRILVIGEMREMGQFSKKVHERIGGEIVNLYKKKSIPFILYAVGKEAWTLSAEVRKKLPHVFCKDLQTQSEAQVEIEKTLQKEDILFVKGSHGVRLDLLVDYFTQSFH